MRLTRRHAWLATVVLGSTLLNGPVATAQEAGYPSRPITLVVTYPPGGGADVMARLIAPRSRL